MPHALSSNRLSIRPLGFVFVLAATTFAAAPTLAAGRPADTRWCSVYNPGLGNIQWHCRFRTIDACAATIQWGRGACLRNPDWDLPRPLARWS